MDNPVFSIVIPVYNTIDELPRCLNGVAEQTFSDYEVVLIDDGSTDGSGDLCDRFAEKDARIRCIHKVNEGAAEARNVGMRNARGEYLTFLDSDDFWDDPHALEEIAARIDRAAKPDTVCFGVEIRDDDGTLVKLRKPSLPEGIGADKESVLRHLVTTNQYFSASYVKVIKRSLLLAHDLFFTKGLVSGEDIEWSGRVMVCCETMAVYPSVFYKRIRRSSGSITSSIKASNIRDVLYAIESGLHYAEERESSSSLLAVYYEYWAYQYAMLFRLVGKLKGDAAYAQLLSEMEKYKWLLKYDTLRKVRLIRRLCQLLGVKKSVELLRLLLH